MGIPEWEEIAIPEGFGPHRLLYNPASETVIAELRSIGEQFFPNQLYIRKKDSLKYEPIKDFEQLVSSESAVTSLGRPLLFYLSNKLTKRDERFSGDWKGLYSFDLQNKTHLKIADKDSLRFPSPQVKGWVTSLVDVSADASLLYLTVGMMPPDKGIGFQMVNHQLARLDLPTGSIHLLSHLKGTFFQSSQPVARLMGQGPVNQLTVHVESWLRKVVGTFRREKKPAKPSQLAS